MKAGYHIASGRLWAILAIAVILLPVGCSGTASALESGTAQTISPESTTAPPTPTPSEEPSATPLAVPAFVPADCRFEHDNTHEVECGDMIVAEDHSQPNNGRTVRFHVAVFRSTGSNPQPDPVVYLSGGGRQLDSHTYYLYAGGDEILRDRDYIMYDRRGEEYSYPTLDCREMTGLSWSLADEGLLSRESDDEFIERFIECHDDLAEQGINLAMYNTAEYAADLEDLRLALGYDQLNLYGTSYGTKLALAYMRYFPEHVRSAILDSVFPPSVNLFSEDATNIHRAFQEVFASCAADAYCRQTYPGLEATFYQTIDDLNSNPVMITVEQNSVLVDGRMLAVALYGRLYSAGSIPYVPRWIEEASQGIFRGLTDEFAAMMRQGGPGTGTFYSGHCNEEVSFDSYENSLALGADLPPQIAGVFDNYMMFKTCESWDSGRADPVENTPVSSDIPALIFAGQYDPVTPPAWGRLAAATLNRHFLYEFSGMSHGIMRSNECGLSIGLQFLADPLTEPDSSCMELLEPLVFE